MPFLLIDAGNLLFKKKPTRANSASAVLKATGIILAYNEMPYDAVAVSNNDLTAGKEFFTKGPKNFPWISANTYIDDNMLLFPPYIIKTFNGLRIGIIGLTGAGPQDIANITIGNWKKSLTVHLQPLKEKSDVIIVLSNLTETENQSLVENFQDVNFLISSIKQRGNMPPRITQKTLITQSGGQGKYLGKLSIDWHPRGTWKHVSAQVPVALLKQKLGAIEWQLKQLTRRTVEGTPDLARKTADLQKKRTEMLAMITAQQNTQVEGLQPIINRFTSTFLPVRPVSTVNNVSKIVNEIKLSINNLARNKNTLLRSRKSNRAHGQNLRATYSGTQSCATCHPEQWDSWNKTAHAHAFTTLARANQSFNSECLPCHVTAGNITVSSPEKERISLLTLPAELRQVGCEVCHGPGKKHASSPETIKLVRRPQPEVCTGCHTPKRDENFDYTKKMVSIGCSPSSNH